MLRSIARLILCILVFSSWLNTSTFAETTAPPITVELFLSSTCPHCQKASAWFQEIQPTLPWLHINAHIVNEDKAALKLYYERLNALNSMQFDLPSMFFCGYRWIGFDTPENSGKQLLKALKYCHENMDSSGRISPAASRTLHQWSQANALEAQTQNPQYSLLQSVILLAFADAFSVCSIFCLAAFMALIFTENTTVDRARVGSAFILSLFFMHYFQQFHSISYFQMLYFALIPGVIISLALFYRCFRGFRNKIVDWVFIAIFGALLFAWQQSCPESWAEANAVWMAGQKVGLPVWVLYQTMYILPLLLLLSGCLYLTRTGLFIRHQAKIFQASSFVLCAIGLCLLVYPSGLANYTLSWILIASVFLAGWLLRLGIFTREH